MTVWAAGEAGLREALPQLAAAVNYAETPPPERKLILKEISA
jgi:hypothetical protein